MKQVISILIDHSGSMGQEHRPEILSKYLVGKKTRLELVQEILRNYIIPNLCNADAIIIQTFRSDSKDVKYDGKFYVECEFDEKELVRTIMSIPNPASGGTPISDGIQEAVRRLSTHHNCTKTLLVITDGEETGHGNYVSLVNETKAKFSKLHIVGIGLDSTLKQKAITATQCTGGNFINIAIAAGDTLESIIVDHKLKLLNFSKILVNSNKEELNSPYKAEELTELNESIRLASEKYLYEFLIKKYGKVLWLNDPIESGENHDFEVLDTNNENPIIYIECKGTPNSKPTFYLTASEWQLALKHGSKYELYFVQNCFSHPNVILITDLIASIAAGKLLPYSFETEQLKPKRIALTITSH